MHTWFGGNIPGETTTSIFSPALHAPLQAGQDNDNDISILLASLA